MMKPLLWISCLLFLLGGCEKKEIQHFQKYQLKGKVEKGPFAKGAEIKVYELSSQLKRTGTSYTKTILDDEGNFDFGEVDFKSPYVELVANGTFYHEITGQLTTGAVALHALADLSEQESVNVNLLTHLEKDRIIDLRNGGKDFQKASALAGKEILTAFGLQRFENDVVNGFSLTDGGKGAGVLSVVSTALLADKSEAEFAGYLTALCEDFSKNGDLLPDTKEEIRGNAVNMDWDKIAKGLIERYRQAGKEITLPELSYFIDWNGDGEAGNEFEGMPGDQKLKFKTDTLFVGVEGGEYTVDIAANIPYNFTYPGIDTVPRNEISEEEVFKFEKSEIDFTTTLDRLHNQLKVSVKPAQGYWMGCKEVTLYSSDGKLQTTLVLAQAGDMNLFKIPQTMLEALNGVLINIRQSLDYAFTMEAFYTQCFADPQNEWQKFYHHDKGIKNGVEVEKAWGMAYKAIANANHACDLLAKHEFGQYCAPLFKTLRCMMYYPLTVLWGNIPYPEHASIQVPLQLTEQEAYEKLAKDLEDNYREIIEWKTRDNENYGDVNQLLLGKVYMHLGKYTEAKKWLQRITASDKYKFNANRQEAMSSSSSELIFGIDLTSYASIYAREVMNNRYLAMGSYSEALLLLAECYHRLGDQNKALEYLNRVRKNYQLPTAADLNSALKATWKELLKGEFSYFAFLKRNDLCEQELGIESYQKLFPLPATEVEFGGTKQNPGY